MTMSKPYVVGIDIGGTNTVFGIVDARGTIIASGSIKTQKYSEVEDYVKNLSEELTKLIVQEKVADQITGIGVGAPNGNYYTGTIEFAPNLPWKGVVPLAQILSEKTVFCPLLLLPKTFSAPYSHKTQLTDEIKKSVARGMFRCDAR